MWKPCPLRRSIPRERRKSCNAFPSFVIHGSGRAYSICGGECMAYEQAQKPAPKEHTLNMLNREKLSLTGVADVSGFDENVIVLVTSLGPLTVRGEGLHIEKIDLNAGQLEVRGRVSDLSYEEPAHEGGFWSRLFG